MLMVGIAVYGVTVGRHQIWAPSNSHLVEKNTKKKHGSGTVWQILGGFPGFQYSLSLQSISCLRPFLGGKNRAPNLWWCQVVMKGGIEQPVCIADENL